MGNLLQNEMICSFNNFLIHLCVIIYITMLKLSMIKQFSRYSYKFGLRKFETKSVMRKKATQAIVKQNQEFLSLNLYFFRQLCRLLYQQRQSSQKITYNPAYCNGKEYNQFTLDKLVQIGIKKLQQHQELQQEQNKQQFWKIFQQSAIFHMKYCPPDQLAKIFYIFNHHLQKHNFSKVFKNKLFQGIVDELPVMTLKQLQYLYLSAQESQYIFVTKKSYFNNTKFLQKIQEKVLDIIEERIPKLQIDIASQWIQLFYWNSINSVMFTNQQLQKKQKTTKIINKLFQHILKSSNQLQLASNLELMKILTFQKYENIKQQKQISDRYAKLKHLLIKILTKSQVFEKFQKDQFISHKLLLQFFSSYQFKNLEIAAMKSLYVRFVYLQELFRHWSFQTLTQSQIISRYQQLQFTVDQMHQLINIPKFCIMIQLGFKFINTLHFKDKSQVLEKFIDELDYIPFGFEGIVRHYSLLSNNITIQKIMAKITSSLARNPQKLTELVEMNHERLVNIQDIKDLKKFFVNLKNLDLRVGQYVLKANNFAHFIDLKQKLVIHCLENNQDFIEFDAKQESNDKAEVIINLKKTKTTLTTTKWYEVKKLMWQKDGYYFVGIHVPSYLQRNWTQRINLFQKSLLQTKTSHQLLQNKAINQQKNT